MARAALCVGINDYPGVENDLHGCVNDARDWAAVLERRGYATRLLLDAAATRAAILAALGHLIGGALPGDSLVFTYSGHGSWVPDDDGDEPDHRDETLCPHDIDRGHEIVDDDLAEVFARKPEGARLYFIADSCHSGTVARFAPSLCGAAGPGADSSAGSEAPSAHGPGADRPTRPRFLPPATFVHDPSRAARLRACGSRPLARHKYPALLIAGCGDAEYSYDGWFDGRPNGVFTHVALRALASDPETPRDWMAAIRRNLPTADHPQTPRLLGSVAARTGPMF